MFDSFQLFLVALVEKATPLVINNLFELVIIPAVLAAWAYIKSRLSASQLAVAKEIVNTFVLAAEQSGLKSDLLATGAQKFNEVYTRTVNELRERGLNKLADNAPLVRGLIEAAVMENFNKFPNLELVEAIDGTTAQITIS